ncbi:MAG: xanthine dehydrogenase family protein molybdopterin-binding subunit [Acidaminobacteraceae bacterium]
MKNKNDYVGKSILRKEGLNKVTGKQKYLNDYYDPSYLHGAIKYSPHGYAKILNIDTGKAKLASGVRAVLIGDDFDFNFGLYLGDKPPIARGFVRHYGEAVAAVVADSFEEANAALKLIDIEYEVLATIKSPSDALKEDAPKIHKDLDKYNHISAIRPVSNTNIANETKIRKGDVDSGFKKSKYIIENKCSIPTGDHVAMEPRAAIAEIDANGDVIISSTTQAPFVVKDLMALYFGIEAGKITVLAPPIGGGFGGKAGIQLEGLTYLLSKAVDGRPVKLVNTRELDLVSSPGHMGLEAEVKLSADENGKFQSVELKYMFDSGAYADYAVNVSRAAAISCTGPYNIANVKCDSLCVYTNHPFATAYRGFGHVEVSYAMERAIDILAKKMDMDPLELRLLNAIKKGDTTPVQSILDDNTGDLKNCLETVSKRLEWDDFDVKTLDNGNIVSKAITSLWKAPAMPTNTDAGAILTFNEDGSCNIQSGVVEIGQGTKTGLCQIVATRLGIDIDKVHVQLEVNTKTSPHDWATAASRGLMMAGRAAIDACDDATRQIKMTASKVFRCPVEDLDIGDGFVFIKDEPHMRIEFKDIVLGYVYENGNAIDGQVIGRGRYITRRLTGIDPETGKGHPDLEWTLGAEGVVVEINPRDYSYKILKAACCMDVGRVINPEIARGQIVGGMLMGLGYSSYEAFEFNSREQVQNETLRDFKVFRYGEQPEFIVDFLETPQQDGPFGARGLGEQSVIGMPGALANAISKALKHEFNSLPLTAESIWTSLERGE